MALRNWGSIGHMTDSHLSLLLKAIDAHWAGVFPRNELLTFLKWEMAAAPDNTVRKLISAVQNDDPDGDLAYEIDLTCKYVRQWEFPEEPDLSAALHESIECTLPELVRSVAHVGGQLGRVRNMLVGVNVRLDLRDSDKALEEALRLVSEELAVLELACEEIGFSSGVAPAFPDDESEGRPSWSSPEGAPLSPNQIHSLVDLAQWNYPDPSYTYAEGIRGHSTPPQLVTQRIQAEEQQQIRETKISRSKDEDDGAMLQECPRYNSDATASCPTGVGDTGMLTQEPVEGWPMTSHLKHSQPQGSDFRLTLNELELPTMNIELPPVRSARIRRAEIIARKVNLLLDTIVTTSGQPFDYATVRDAAQEAGCYFSRTRWSLLKNGKEQVIADEALNALAVVFDIDPEYLLQEDGPLPEKVEAKVVVLRRERRAEVLSFAARALGPVDPEALKAIAEVLDEAV